MAAAAMTPRKAKSRGPVVQQPPNQGGQRQAAVDFARSIVLKQNEVAQGHKRQEVGEQLRQNATVDKLCTEVSPRTPLLVKKVE